MRSMYFRKSAPVVSPESRAASMVALVLVPIGKAKQRLEHRGLVVFARVEQICLECGDADKQAQCFRLEWIIGRG